MHHRDLDEDALLLAGLHAAALQLVFVERDEVVVLLGGRVVLGEERERLGLTGLQIEHGLVDLDRAIGLVQLARDGAAGAEAGGEALGLRRAAHEHLLLHARGGRPVAGLNRDDLGEVRRPPVLRVEIEGAVEPLLHVGSSTPRRRRSGRRRRPRSRRASS